MMIELSLFLAEQKFKFEKFSNKFQLRRKVRNDRRHKNIKHLAVYQIDKVKLRTVVCETEVLGVLCQNKCPKIIVISPDLKKFSKGVFEWAYIKTFRSK